ncbi:MAG TPA: alpha/beta fold hydrolase [Actinomycetota bacterium]|jgi:2,6-dihydroxypseudooxynicotine hydrolase|nr:alpha/beta fold hydrolase [Actinomycetota bacterium]
MNESDRREIDQYYATLSNWIRLYGAEELGRKYVIVRLARMEVNSRLDGSDLHRILERVVDARSWHPSWREEAQAAEAEAERLVAEGRTASAGDLFLRAADCYHWGQYLARIFSDEKAEGRAGRVRCYRRGIEVLDAGIEPFAVALGDHALPGYLHLPAGGAGPPPCVVMVNGADSVKEEYHNWARDFVRRGLAVLTFDGPGQGELAGRIPMRPESWEKPMRAVVDALERSGLVDAGRIGAWGSSMGGFLVSRAAAFEPRLRAAVSSGGFYDFRDYTTWPLSTQLNVMEDLGVDSLDESRAYVAERCSLEGVAERIEVPYLVIHGARDELVSVTEAQRMADEAPHGEFVCFEDGFHTCTNHNAELVRLMCDWMAAKLVAIQP